MLQETNPQKKNIFECSPCAVNPDIFSQCYPLDLHQTTRLNRKDAPFFFLRQHHTGLAT